MLEEAVDEFATLPGIGKKTALRLVLHLLKQEEKDVERFGNTVLRMKSEIRTCITCHNISDAEVCQICSDPYRDKQTVCVVESIRDVMSVENTQQFSGTYHVLGGIISPMDGIGPADLTLGSLEKKVRSGSCKEIILALSTTMEGDTTNFFIFRQIEQYQITTTTIARGISVGDELEYADEVTLSKALEGRHEI